MDLMASYNRYSHHARRALTHAGLLVMRFYHPRVDTAHLLVGVLHTEGSIGYAVLTEFGLDVESAENHLSTLTLPLKKPPEHLNHDAALDLALELAADESVWLGHHYIGTEHLLLGITRTNLGNAGDLLRALNVAPEQVRRRVRHAVKDGQYEFTLQFLRRNARFSELSRRVLNAAEQLSISLDHQTIGVGHLILALITEQRGAAARAMYESGLDVQRLHRDLEQQHPPLLISIENLLNQSLELSEQRSSHYTCSAAATLWSEQRNIDSCR
jgi:ATP-dependent Clp protease ATP-binding subunit ClpA